MKIPDLSRYALGISAGIAILAGCNAGGSQVAPALGPMQQSATQVLPAAACSKAACVYVTNGLLAYSAPPPSVTVYAANADGNVPPIQTISGSRTQLNDPMGIALDAGGNTYVTNWASSAVTVYGPDASGNAAPIRTIDGSKTSLDRPNGIALDRGGTLYVANGGGSVTVYAPGAHGNVSPIRMISGSNTGFNSESDLALAANGNLQVLDNACRRGCDSSLLTFHRDANGNVAPIRSFSLDHTAFSIALDEHGDALLPGYQIFGFNPRVVILGRSGQPIRHIGGRDTQLSLPHGIAVAKYGSIYVTNGGSVAVYAPNAHGDAAPIRVISGMNTGLAFPNGIAVH